LWFAGLIEFAADMLLIGLFSRLAALIMLGATTYSHALNSFYPIVNRGDGAISAVSPLSDKSAANSAEFSSGRLAEPHRGLELVAAGVAGPQMAHASFIN
jgi:hypothetical protein